MGSTQYTLSVHLMSLRSLPLDELTRWQSLTLTSMPSDSMDSHEAFMAEHCCAVQSCGFSHTLLH